MCPLSSGQTEAGYEQAKTIWPLRFSVSFSGAIPEIVFVETSPAGGSSVGGRLDHITNPDRASFSSEMSHAKRKS